MSRTFRKTNPRTVANDFYCDDTVHFRGDGNVRSDKFAGWELDYGKESGEARRGSARRMRAAERRALDAIRAHGADADGVVWPMAERTQGWLTH